MEIVALLTQAKAMGFDIGSLISLAVIYLSLRRDLMKMTDKQFDKLIQAIKSLEKAHNDRLSKIEVHVGLRDINNTEDRKWK